MSKAIYDIIQDRILILDGAMGTMINDMILQNRIIVMMHWRSSLSTQRGWVICFAYRQPDIKRNSCSIFWSRSRYCWDQCTFLRRPFAQADYHLDRWCIKSILKVPRLPREVMDGTRKIVTNRDSLPDRWDLLQAFFYVPWSRQSRIPGH